MARQLMSGRQCAVLGDPIAHSLSPTLHRAGYAELGLDWTYAAQLVPSGGLPGFLASLDPTWRGLSLTMPLKREAVGLATSLTDRARLAGAANTLVLEGGAVLADNTDIPGVAAALRERYAGPVDGAMILGGGATATSAGLALCDLGARELSLIVRSRHRAQETLDSLTSHPSRPIVRIHPIAAHDVDQVGGRAPVVVSTIPVEAQTPELLSRVAGVPVVFEVLYDPWPTPLAMAAGGNGQVLVGGLDLLVHQAAIQFALFTGLEAPIEAMRAAGEAELARRSGSRG
jgi:shikimate dehydrogenase